MKIMIGDEMCCSEIATQFLTQEERSKKKFELPYKVVKERLTRILLQYNHTPTFWSNLAIMSTTVLAGLIGGLYVNAINANTKAKNIDATYVKICTFVGCISFGIFAISRWSANDHKQSPRIKNKIEKLLELDIEKSTKLPITIIRGM